MNFFEKKMRAFPRVLLAILIGALISTCVGQDLHPALSPTDAAAVSALSKYFYTGSTDRLDRVLALHGFQTQGLTQLARTPGHTET